jgi:hypothetical protein
MVKHSALVCLLPLLLSACALHSETREKQSLAARDAWKKVDLEGQLASARKAEAQILFEQLRTEDDIQRARRDALARGMVYGGTVNSKLLAPIEKELMQLFVPNDARKSLGEAEKWLLARDDQADARKAFDKFDLEFRRAGLEPPTCESVKSGTPQGPAAAWDGIVNACRNPRLNAADSYPLPESGSLKKQHDLIVAAAGELAGAKSASLNQRNAYRAAAKVYADELAKLERDPLAARDRLEQARDGVGKAMKALEALEKAGADAFASKVLAEARLDMLNKQLSSRYLAAGAEVADGARVALAEARQPRLAPLVVAKNLESAKADAAKRDADIQLRKEQLLRDQLKWMTAKVRALVDAHAFAAKADPNAELASMLRPQDPLQLKEKDRKAIIQAKADVWKAAAIYLDSEGRMSAEINKIDYQLRALEHEKALSYAESSISQWNSLIYSVIEQQVEYGAAGIRQADITALINSLALLWIGVGVN